MASAALVVLVGCSGSTSSGTKGAAGTSTSAASSPAGATTSSTAIGTATSATTQTPPPPIGTSPVTTNPAITLPSLQVTSPQSGQTVGLPLVVQYVVTGVTSADGLSLRVAIVPDYQVEIPLTALNGSVPVPGSKMISGLRDLTVTLLEHGTAAPSPRAAVTVSGLLITGGR